MVEIALSPAGFAFIPIYFAPPYKQGGPYHSRVIDGKVDTGANQTTIGFRQLLQLGYTKDWVERKGKYLQPEDSPTVASGAILPDCYNIILPEIRIGGYIGRNWPFLTSLSANLRLLLGTDTLKFFNWIFDYENNKCTFLVRSDKHGLPKDFNIPGQTIHFLDEIHPAATKLTTDPYTI
jgi:hypothetical protein